MRVERRGEGQLDEDPVHMIGGVELFDAGLELGPRRGAGQPHDFGPKPQGPTGFLLHPDVALRRGIVADDHGHQSGDRPFGGP